MSEKFKYYVHYVYYEILVGGLTLNEEDKNDFIKDFKKADGAKRLDLWDYALGQQVLWENVIADLQRIAKEQGVDKELEKMMDEDMKKL